MPNNVRLLEISAQAMREILKLPESTRILGAFVNVAEFEKQGACVVLKIEDEQFSEVQSGQLIPRVSAVYESEFVSVPRFKGYS